MVYVALLRGINVGGSNKVDMKELKALFEAAAMTQVRTYINSGNVIFSTDMSDRASLAELLEKAMLERFGFDVHVLLRDMPEMRSIVNAIPAEWTNDGSTKCDFMFLWEDVDSPSVLERLQWDHDVEDVLYAPGAVIRRIDRKYAAKSGLLKIVGTPLHKRMTIRNCNTARKLLALMEA